MLKNIIIIILIAYAGWLSTERIYNSGVNDGVLAGYEQGLVVGYKAGRDTTCAVNLI